MRIQNFSVLPVIELRKTESHLGQQCAQGQRAAYLVSAGALEREAGDGCGCSDRSQGYSEQMQQSLT